MSITIVRLLPYAVTPAELARSISLPRRVIYDAINNKTLRCKRIGKHHRITALAAMEWLEAHPDVITKGNHK